MIDLEDNDVIEALNKAGWVRIMDDDVVISRGVLHNLIFQAQTAEEMNLAKELVGK